MIQLVTEPLSYEFMRRALFAAALTGAITSLIGTYVVLRGMAFLGGALSHAVLPGAAIAYVWGHSTALGAFFAGLFTAAGIGFVGRHPDLKQDTAIGILMSGMFALGIAIISTIKTYTVDLANFLLAMSWRSPWPIWLMMCISVLILLALWLFHHRWVILGFDPNLPLPSGCP